MERIPITEKRKNSLLFSVITSIFKIVDNRGKELESWEYEKFIEAMFSGNPSVNLNALERAIRRKRTTGEGV